VNTKLLGLLQRNEWLYRDRFERASMVQQSAHDTGKALPHSPEAMIQLEMDMLRAQIELAREEENTEVP